MVWRFGIFILGLLLAAPVGAADSASILLYHRFAETAHPSTSVRLEQLEAHIQVLRDEGARVMPLPEIIAAFESETPLPDRAVAITVDDAFLSAYRVAWPRWRAAGLTFTLFVATQSVDLGLPDYMTWDQIRELRDAGVTIGSQTARHPHLPAISDAALAEELAHSNRRFVEELGQPPALIAYPYGEAGLREWQAARAAGFQAGFGQHSGVAHGTEDRFYLPRFALNEQFGDADRVRLVSAARPLAVKDWSPTDPVLHGPNPPPIGFTVSDPPQNLSALACYSSHADDLKISILGQSRVEIRTATALPRGRTRLSCTLPTANGRWRWVGRQILVP
ncbi:polysaccharide deacetylase family protein [Magnetospira thiophila]